MSGTAWVFPGQGSQRRGMGADLLDSFPQECALADRVLGFPVRELCLHDPDRRLRSTRYAQPALFLVNALSYLARRRTEPEPSYLAGHSLGELTALWAAGSFDLETGLWLVRRRGELMAAEDGGQMVAVLGLDAGRVAELIARAGAAEVDIANHNSRTQVVISGPKGTLDPVVELLTGEPGTRCVPLNVSAAFHSRSMAAAAEQFAGLLGQARLGPPRIPVLSNVTGLPYPDESPADLLSRQITSPVRWRASMRFLLEQGVRELVEVGPGTVLSGLWREIRAETDPGAAAPPVPAAPTVAAVGPTAPAPTLVPAAPPPVVADESEEAERAARTVGSAAFREAFGVRYACLAGSMYRGIASVDLVIRLGRRGLLGFFGAGGLSLAAVEDALVALESRLGRGGPYGVNLLYPHGEPELEQPTVELYLRRGVRHVEAAAYTRITPALVQLRFSGARQDRSGRPRAGRNVVAKVSRPETAAAFLSPPPAALLDQLVVAGRLDPEEARLARMLPMSEDVCVEGDSGGHTDGGVLLAVLPSITRLRDEIVRRHRYPVDVRVGAAGGLGAPEALAAAVMLGADFLVTGSVNQCSPESGTSVAVKQLLATLDVQDTAYAPAGDLFELGSRVQVVRKGTLFAARANKLHHLYQTHRGLEEIDASVRDSLERTYFRRSLAEVWRETQDYHRRTGGEDELARADRDPRHRMALVFRWYFAHSTVIAVEGRTEEQVNFQVHCGPAMGAFNRVVAGTALEDWRNRHVDLIAETLMRGAADLLRTRTSEQRQREYAG